MKNKIIALIMFFAVINIAAALEFYEGDAYINNIDATINVGEKLSIGINYGIYGTGIVNLDFYDLPDNAVVMHEGNEYSKKADLELDGFENIIVIYEQEINDGILKRATFNPDLRLDGKINKERIGEYTVKINSPYKIIKPSIVPSYVKEDINNYYVWNYSVYNPALSFSWLSEGIDIEVVRKLPDELSGLFTVETILTNNGIDLENVLLVTSFQPADFTPKSNLDEFETILDGNDIRTEWKKRIPLLKKGETKTFTYELEPSDYEQNVVLRPVFVYVDGNFAYESERLDFVDLFANYEGKDDDALQKVQQQPVKLQPREIPRIEEAIVEFPEEDVPGIPESEESIEEALERIAGERSIFEDIKDILVRYKSFLLFALVAAIVAVFVFWTQKRKKEMEILHAEMEKEMQAKKLKARKRKK